MPAANRNRLYTLLQVGKTDLHMDEDDYRSLLARHGAKADAKGRYSATSMSVKQLLDAIDDMKSKGFVPKGGNYRQREDWRTRRIKKITALWCALSDAGEVRERGYTSMERWCRTLTHTNKLEWADGVSLNNCIEALKSWCHRKGVAIVDG